MVSVDLSKFVLSIENKQVLILQFLEVCFLMVFWPYKFYMIYWTLILSTKIDIHVSPLVLAIRVGRFLVKIENDFIFGRVHIRVGLLHVYTIHIKIIILKLFNKILFLNLKICVYMASALPYKFIPGRENK